jgi:hypothetical protein
MKFIRRRRRGERCPLSAFVPFIGGGVFFHAADDSIGQRYADQEDVLLSLRWRAPLSLQRKRKLATKWLVAT